MRRSPKPMPLYPCQPRRHLLLCHTLSDGQGRVLGGLWEGNADGDLHVADDHTSGFSMLQEPGDKVPFIEIDLRKSPVGLPPSLGLLALAFPSFLGTPNANFSRP